jgi:cell division protein FtsW (lipid II flippase)
MTRQYPLLPWFIGADVLFVGLACLVALAGHAPIRWVVVVFLVVLAGITGFLAFYAIPTPTIRPESPEEKERPKIRVHFVDELPKKRR